MVLIANPDLIEIIAADLNSNDAAVEKLHELNNDPILNDFLVQKNYKPIIQAVNQLLNKEESDVNKDTLETYLQELGLIFNLF